MTIKPDAPSCHRNRDVILALLLDHFADRERVLEIGSGTGQHAVYFGAAMPQLIWQTSERAEHHDGIRAWLDEAALPNVLAPIELDVTGEWPAMRYDGFFTANTLHIMSAAAVEQLFAALPAVMQAGAKFAVYGPFNYGGRFTSDSNCDFDDWLKARDPLSGIRDFEWVDALAQRAGFTLIEDRAMPANNRGLVWQAR
jgi:cyclopropane fatty-acyl-phospholipid synthase-like methyltransferase